MLPNSYMCCSGMRAKDTICAEMAFMLMERNNGASSIDYPLGGSGAICDALVRGIEKNGGQVILNARVEEIIMDGEFTCWMRYGDLHVQPQTCSRYVCQALFGGIEEHEGWVTMNT